MKRLQTTFKWAAVALLLCLPVLSQSSQSDAQHFAKDGVVFDYPAQWVLSDKSNPQAQHLVITHAGSSALIMVIVYRDPITSFDLLTAMRRDTTEAYIENVAQQFGAAGTPAKRESLCTEVGAVENVAGTKLRGSMDKQPGTGEIYSLLMGHRFVNLVYIRMDKDDAQATPAWDTVRRSLKVDEAATTAAAVEPGLDSPEPLRANLGGGLVLNGKALSLPRPEYPDAAKGVHASGTVNVKVTIDEKGNVISSLATTGHPALRAAAEEAARRARFSPTLLCNKPVKVTGIISYNFVPQ